MIATRKAAREEISRLAAKNRKNGEWEVDTGDPYRFFVPKEKAQEVMAENEAIEKELEQL